MSESPEVPDEEPVPVIDSDAKDTSEATVKTSSNASRTRVTHSKTRLVALE